MDAVFVRIWDRKDPALKQRAIGENVTWARYALVLPHGFACPDLRCGFIL
jgi:hypothetical protein